MGTAMKNDFDYALWLSANTAYCKRHRCRLTLDDCTRQRKKSQGEFSDLRCQGCGGLDNQPEAVDLIGGPGWVEPRRLHIVKPTNAETLPVDSAEKEEPQTQTAARISAEVEQETAFDLDCLNVLNSCENTFDFAAITALTGDNGELARELQYLFMEEDEEVETKEEIAALFTKTRDTAKPRRFAVYQGRCTRCGGYVENTREQGIDRRWDDDAHRCLACGWRTSPAYAWNRENPHLSGWRG